MKDQTNEEPTDPVEGERPDQASRPGNAPACQGGKHGEVQEDPWMEQVLDRENLVAAWKRVKASGGVPGIDAMNVDDFLAFARRDWERICADLRAGTYRPAPVRWVFIPKPDGSQRPLGVPTVLDRVIQQAITQVLTPLYDKEFSEQSYGFRAGRNAHQAVRQVKAAWGKGR